MKKSKTPKTYDVIVMCQTCENTMTLKSTSLLRTTDTCRVCHPAYSGKQQVRDTHGRIEKFNSRYAHAIAQA